MIDKHKKNTEQELDAIRKYEEKAKVNFFEIEKKLVSLEQRLNEFYEKNRSPEHNDFDNRIDNLEKVIANLEHRIIQKSDQPQSIISETDISNIVKRVENSLLQRISQIQSNLATIEEKTNKELFKIEASERAYEQSFGKELSPMHEELKEAIVRAEQLKNELKMMEDKFVTKEKFNELSSSAENYINTLYSNLDKVSAMERSLDTHLILIEEKIKDYLEKMNHTFDSRVIEMEERLSHALRNVPVKEQLEKTIELEVLRILTHKLEKFAEMLDHKFMHFMPREEFQKHMVLMDGRIAMIEAPNIRPLARRIDELELKISDLSMQIEHAVSRIPLVVE